MEKRSVRTFDQYTWDGDTVHTLFADFSNVLKMDDIKIRMTIIVPVTMTCSIYLSNSINNKD